MLNLLIAGNAGFTEEELEKIKSIGYSVTTVDREDSKQIPEPSVFDVVICNWLFVRHSIEDFTGLKAVQLLSAGLDRMPMEYAREKHIEVQNARGIYSIPIAEFTVMSVLDAYKHSDFFYANQLERRWSKHRDLDELSDKTVCIFGTGSVGTEVAKRFSVFTEKIIGIDLYPEQKPFFTEVVGLEKKEEALHGSDIVVLTLPLTDETRHMFNAELISEMKDDAVLVNVARGALIDEQALQGALSNGKFRAVILDVFEKEPLDEEYWGWNADRVRIIPHNTFESRKNSERMKKQIMNNLENWSRQFQG